MTIFDFRLHHFVWMGPLLVIGFLCFLVGVGVGYLVWGW